MNYTIFTRVQVIPREIVSHGATSDVWVLNPGSPPVYPAEATLLYTPDDLDIYSADPLKRRVLLADPNGTATFANVTAAFPGYLASLMDVVRDAAQRHILTAYPLWYQTNVALGIYGQPIADKMRDDIVAVITESNRCEQLIFEGQPYVLNLPTIGG